MARRAETPGPGNGGFSSDATSTLLTAAQAARLWRDAMKDKSYRAFPLGLEAGHYLRAKRKRLTASSYRDYESCLDKLARYFADLEIGDLEPPVGTQRLEEFLDAQWGESAGRTYNKNLSILRDFFKFQVLRGNLHGDPTLAIERARKRDVLPDDVQQRPGTRDRRLPGRAARPGRGTAASELRAPQGRVEGAPVQALRPPPETADGVHEGREGARDADPAPGVLVRPRTADPRSRQAQPSHYLMQRQQTHPVRYERRQGGRVRDAPLSRPADGRPRPARLVVRLPRAGRDRRSREPPAASGCTRRGTPPASVSSTRPAT